MVTCPGTDGGSCWGIKVYGALLDYLDRLARNEIFYCVRPFHLLWEHKNAWLTGLDIYLNVDITFLISL